MHVIVLEYTVHDPDSGIEKSMGKTRDTLCTYIYYVKEGRKSTHDPLVVEIAE